MKKERNEDMLKALAEVKLSQLPKKASEKVVWVKAIIKATTNKGKTTYCIGFQNDLGGIPVIKKTFTNEVILRFEEVYPYVVLPSEVVKTITNSTKEEIYETLKPLLYKKDIEAYSEEELKRKALQMQIDATLIDKPKI